MKIKSSERSLEKLQAVIFSTFLKENYRMSNKDFSRERKQSFSGTILFLINFLTKSLSLEIVNFIKYISQYKSEQKEFTQSAFAQARKKIKPEVFCHLNKVLVDDFYTDNANVKTAIDNFRILAIDGSNITLPQTKELEKIYGRMTNNTSTHVVQAKVSVLYDVLNKISIDAILSPINIGERAQALELLKHCKHGDLLLYDRGYPSFEFINTHINKQLDYLIRVKVDFNIVVKEFVASGKKSLITDIKPANNIDFTNKDFTKNSTVKVRLIRVVLSSGQGEVLMTSLLDSNKYKNNIFSELYFERWKIETHYDELKNKLRIENFSGYSNHSIQQDFYSTLLVSNIQSIIVEEINEELPQNKKFQYKVNTSISYGFLKNSVISLLFSPQSMQDTIKELKRLFKNHLVPIRPGRSHPRNMDKTRLRRNIKTPKNHRINI